MGKDTKEALQRLHVGPICLVCYRVSHSSRTQFHGGGAVLNPYLPCASEWVLTWSHAMLRAVDTAITSRLIVQPVD